MTDRELMQQALEALNRSDYLGWQLNIPIIKALRERLAQPEPTSGNVLMDAYNAMVDKKRKALEQPECNKHPDAPHGFNRESSHSLGRYVCDCEGWEPEPWDTTDMAYRVGGLSIGQDKNICDSSSQTSVTQNISNKLEEKNS